MPTIQSLDIPKPGNWQDFETIVRDAQAQRWKSTNLQKNGRLGQRQNGVDIHGHDDIGRPVGIQCKRYKESLKIDDIISEIGNAEKFVGQLTTLYIATTTAHDATLQQKVRILSDKRVAQGKFAVSLLFWDEIVSSLALNPSVLRAHYPQIIIEAPVSVDQERLIAALELGYFGADIWSYIVLIYGEFGQMAQTDPDELIAKFRILESRTQQLFSPDDAAPILESLSHIRAGCQAQKNSRSEWDPVETYAKRVSSRLQSASSLLCLVESNTLELGLHLGRIYHHTDDLPSASVRRAIKAKIISVLPEASVPAINSKFTQTKKLTSGYRWATSIYGFVDHELRYQSRK